MEALIARLAALPAVRAAAEEHAQALTDTIARSGREAPFWDALPERMRLERVNAHLSRLLDPTNPAAEGVLADIYRRVTGRESAHVEADSVTADDRVFNWQIVHLDPSVGMARMPAWVDIDGTQAPTRYEAWGRALLAHYDVDRKDGTGY